MPSLDPLPDPFSESAPPLASEPALEFAEASPLAPPLAFEESEPPEAEAEEFADAESDAPLPAEELEEEPLELSEPQALSATMLATARDTKAEVFLAVIRLSFLPVIIDWFSTLSHTDGIFQELSPPCGSFYAKSNT